MVRSQANKFGKLIRERRRLLNLTQEELARRIRVSMPFVGHLETGHRRPSEKTIAKLAIATASVLVGVALSVSTVVPTVYAAEQVDCDAVRQELGQGKTLRQVASDMKISVGRVRGCKKRASRAAKAEEKTSPGNRERMTRSEASRAASRGARSSPEAAQQASPAPSR